MSCFDLERNQSAYEHVRSWLYGHNSTCQWECLYDCIIISSLSHRGLCQRKFKGTIRLKKTRELRVKHEWPTTDAVVDLGSCLAKARIWQFAGGQDKRVSLYDRLCRRALRIRWDNQLNRPCASIRSVWSLKCELIGSFSQESRLYGNRFELQLVVETDSQIAIRASVRSDADKGQ